MPKIRRVSTHNPVPTALHKNVQRLFVTAQAGEISTEKNRVSAAGSSNLGGGRSRWRLTGVALAVPAFPQIQTRHFFEFILELGRRVSPAFYGLPAENHVWETPSSQEKNDTHCTT